MNSLVATTLQILKQNHMRINQDISRQRHSNNNSGHTDAVVDIGNSCWNTTHCSHHNVTPDDHPPTCTSASVLPSAVDLAMAASTTSTITTACTSSSTDANESSTQ